ncbi:MAG: respiratory nitrate reductase subunit gamma [Proteobacteria bacterium]|nr:respiratory nitrate reductase subunit gamma [Pseudomonadota bacterium]
MHAFYNLVSGPLVWVAAAIFLGGSFWKVYSLLSGTKKKDGYVFEYWSWGDAIKSYIHWLLPFMSENSRQQPVMSVITFLAHLGIVLVPIFTMGHLVLLEEGILGWSWMALPGQVADIAAWIVIAGCCFFAYRRLVLPQVKFVTSCSDFVILVIVAAPFITGVMAYHGWGDNLLMTSLHMFSGEIMLAAIPFTKLSHMLTFWYTRGYTASEFGAVRKVCDW